VRRSSKFLQNTAEFLDSPGYLIARLVLLSLIIGLLLGAIIVETRMSSSTPAYEWIFSGIGVFALSVVGAWLYRRWFKKKEGQLVELTPVKRPQTGLAESQVLVSDSTISGPVAGRDINIESYVQHAPPSAESVDEYSERPTPDEMYKAIRAVSFYTQEHVADNYAGLKVRWHAKLSSMRQLSGDVCDVSLRTRDQYLVATKVSLSRYPILKTVRGGEAVEVIGTIDYVQTNGPVHLKESKLKFLPKEALKSPLHEIRFDYLPLSPLENGWAKPVEKDETPEFSTDKTIPGSLYVQADGRVFAMDYAVPPAGANAHQIEFEGKFLRNAILYTEIELMEKSAVGKTETCWFAHVLGLEGTPPQQDRQYREWIFTVAPIRSSIQFKIDLAREVNQAFGRDKTLTTVKRIRLRGNIVLSSIKLIGEEN